MEIFKLRIITDNDIITALGILKSKNPLTLEIPKIDKSLLIKNIKLELQWNENGAISEVDVKFMKNNSNLYVFDFISEVRAGLERDYYRIDYKGFYKVKTLRKETLQSISRMVTSRANHIKTSVASKIKQIIPNETSSNQHILRFLLEIDSKLDRVLNYFEEEKTDEDFIIVNAIDISAGGLCFFSKEKFEKSELLYLDVELTDTANKVEFVSLGEILNTIETPEGFIYSLEFKNLDNEFSENIIKYVFEKERKMIQELKNR
jgi:hypothetical protein